MTTSAWPRRAFRVRRRAPLDFSLKLRATTAPPVLATRPPLSNILSRSSQLMAAALWRPPARRATANLSQSNLVRVTGKRRRSPCSTPSDIVA